jgi:hypothetical protein
MKSPSQTITALVQVVNDVVNAGVRASGFGNDP